MRRAAILLFACARGDEASTPKRLYVVREHSATRHAEPLLPTSNHTGLIEENATHGLASSGRLQKRAEEHVAQGTRRVRKTKRKRRRSGGGAKHSGTSQTPPATAGSVQGRAQALKARSASGPGTGRPGNQPPRLAATELPSNLPGGLLMLTKKRAEFNELKRKAREMKRMIFQTEKARQKFQAAQAANDPNAIQRRVDVEMGDLKHIGGPIPSERCDRCKNVKKDAPADPFVDLPENCDDADFKKFCETLEESTKKARKVEAYAEALTTNHSGFRYLSYPFDKDHPTALRDAYVQGQAQRHAPPPAQGAAPPAAVPAPPAGTTPAAPPAVVPAQRPALIQAAAGGPGSPTYGAAVSQALMAGPELYIF